MLATHVFKHYVRHMLLKYIKNGYDRVEFRAFPWQLNEYDQNGNLVKTHHESAFMTVFD